MDVNDELIQLGEGLKGRLEPSLIDMYCYRESGAADLTNAWWGKLSIHPLVGLCATAY